MLYVDVRKSWKFGYETHPLSNCVGVKIRCFKIKICLWDVYVGVRLLYYMGRTFWGWGSILLEEMFINVCVWILRLINLKCNQYIYFVFMFVTIL
jgi:hypothetical protein